MAVRLLLLLWTVTSLSCGAGPAVPIRGLEQAHTIPVDGASPRGTEADGVSEDSRPDLDPDADLAHLGIFVSSLSEDADLHRGDWEPPDVLVIAYDEEWRDAMVRLIETAQDEVEVYVLASDDHLADSQFFQWLSSHGADVMLTEHDTPWVRDYGPLQRMDRKRKSVRWLDLLYSAERPLDDAVPERMAAYLNVPVELLELWIDGGAVVSNGLGLCAMTDESFDGTGIDATDAEQIERLLSALGCRILSVLPALPGEETGHADVFVQFLGPQVVAVSTVDPSALPDLAWRLDEAVFTLEHAGRLLGRPLTVVRVPMDVQGETFYSYVNGTRLSGRFLVPDYNDVDPDMQREAYGRLRAAMPWVTLFPIQADAMARRGGAIHCLTLGLNLPAEVRNHDRRLARRVSPRALRRWLGSTTRSRPPPGSQPPRNRLPGSAGSR